MVGMFKNLFKKNAKPTVNTNEVIVPCACEENNEHCDLIFQLRKKQALRKDIKDEISALNKDNSEPIFNFVDFLKTLERAGYVMDRNTRYSTVFYEANIDILRHIINGYSSADIFRITEELKTCKNKENIICEKQRALKAVEDDIKNIKIKLGIE